MFRSGQITILVLLLSLLGLTTALSVASRSLSDLKQVTQVDVGTKAFAAAEAGLEFALNEFSRNFNPDCTVQTANLTIPGISGINYTICPNSKDYASWTNVFKDDVFQVVFPTNNPNNLKSANVLWENPAAAIEIDVIDNGGTVSRYFSNPVGSTTANGFATGSNVANCISSTCNDPAFSSWSSCVIGIANIDNASMIRIKPLYANSSVAICGQTAGGSPGRIPLQNYVITVTATSTNGTVRKIQVIKTPPVLPAIFDNVLYTSGSIVR